jgi:acyl carrier protein
MTPDTIPQRELEAVVIAVLQEVARAGDLPDVVASDTPLFGRDGVLDSAGLVALVVGVEQAVEERWNRSVTLADERALSQRHSPFRTVGSLATYAGQQL